MENNMICNLDENPRVFVIGLLVGMGVTICEKVMENHYKGKIQIGSIINIELEPAS